jgi:hypothetical protein
MVILPTKVKLFTAHLSQKTKMGFLVMTLSFPPALSITGCIHTAPPAPSTTRNTGQQSYGGQLPWTCQSSQLHLLLWLRLSCCHHTGQPLLHAISIERTRGSCKLARFSKQSLFPGHMGFTPAMSLCPALL